MSPLDSLLFEAHSEPLLLLESSSLTIRAANNAAQVLFGYGATEISVLRATDLGFPEVFPAPDAPDAAIDGTFVDLGIHLLRDADGNRLRARMWVQELEQDGEALRLIRLQHPSEASANHAHDDGFSWKERADSKSGERATRRFQALFEGAPAALLGLEPEDFKVVAVSNAYLEAARMEREAILGRSLFEVFPNDSVEDAAASHRALRESLEYVRGEGRSDAMGVRPYAVRSSPSPASGAETRYWSIVNTPVQDKRGQIVLLIHRIEDVTELVLKGNPDSTPPLEAGSEGGEHELDLLLRARELQLGNDGLRYQAAVLRNAQRLMHMGTWSINPANECFEASAALTSMLCEADAVPPSSFNAFLLRVHPDDREARAQLQEALLASNRSLSCEYRLQHADGSLREIQEVAESLSTDEGTVVYGALRDVTEEKRAQRRLNDMHRLVQLVGKSARFGGWRFDVREESLQWGLETARIHGLSEKAAPPDVDTAIGFYIPEHRSRIRDVFARCVTNGVPFDEVLQLRTAEGRHIWVRTIGAPEWDDDGRVVAVYGSIQDVNELITAQERYDALARHLRETLEHVNEGFVTLNHDWRLTFVNRTAAELAGQDPEAVIDQIVWDVVPELADSDMGKRLAAAMGRAEPDSVVGYFAPLEKWVELRMHPTDEGLAVYSRDVTDERMRHERLRLLETAVSRLNDIVLITEAEPIDEPDGPKILYANQALERRTGYAVEDVIGRTPRFLQGPSTQRTELDRMRRAMERWQPVRVELINYKRDGTPFWLELDLAPIADDTGWYTHWVAVERDITDRKRAEEAARINAERFDLVARATNDVVWDWDLQKDSLWWNEGIQALFGHSPDALEPGSESWKNRIHPKDRERVVAGIEGVIRGHESRWLDEYRFLRADGVAVTVIDRGFVLRDAAGRAIRMVGAMIDVSERRELDERLRQSQKLETLGQLTGGVAHDFNNLLTVILGNSEMLSRRLADNQQLCALAEMTATAAERGAELTSRLLSFARRQPLDPQVVDCNSLLGEMDLLFRRTLPENIALKVARSEGLWATEVDPSQLENALLNLVLNARDAMPDGGRLTIETANIFLDEEYASRNEEVTAGGYVALSVMDNGRGMAPEQSAQAFEPFFTTKEVGKGSGLGLSMVYGFVKQSGGHVKIYSEPGEGTTVRLYFPRTEAGQKGCATEGHDTPMRGGSEHILVVEDDPLVRAHLSEQLESLGYRVSLAASGPEALQLLLGLDKVDLLFTDVVMPGGMDGRELAEEVARLHPGTHTLFTSGYTENAIVHQGRLDPGVHLLSKPYRQRELGAKVRQVLDGE